MKKHPLKHFANDVRLNEAFQEIHHLTHLLVIACKGETDLPVDLAEWWTHRKLMNAERKAAAKAEVRRKKLTMRMRRAALRKLSPAERKILGIKLIKAKSK